MYLILIWIPCLKKKSDAEETINVSNSNLDSLLKKTKRCWCPFFFFLFSFFVDKCGCSSLLWLCYIFGNSFRSPLFIGNSSPSVLLLWYYCSSQKKKKKKKFLLLLLMLLFFFKLLICPFLSVKFYYQILLTITCMCILLYYTICYHPFQKKKIKKKIL